MALTRTTTAVALGANDDFMIVTSATGATVGAPVLIEDEVAIVASISSTTIGLKRRGTNGTLCKAHNKLATVVFSASGADFTAPHAGMADVHANPHRDVEYYSVDGAVTVPNRRDKVVYITKAGVCALTIADPSVGQDGIKISFISLTANAHTVTLTTGYGGSNATDVFTFSGAVGDSVSLISGGGVWRHLATGLVAADTVSATVA